MEEVAEKIAVAAFRFELVKQDPDKMIAFDIESSLELQGETGPYLLYSYARARRIISKAGSAPSIDVAGAAKLSNPKEVELIKRLSMFDKAIMEAASTSTRRRSRDTPTGYAPSSTSSTRRSR